MRSTILVATVAVLLSSALPSTSHAAYQNGDLYLLSLGVPNSNNTKLLQGIVRIDPTSGVSSLFYHTGLTLHGFVDYDAYRDLLVFTQSDSLLGINSSGTLTLLNHLPTNQVGALVARGDGPVFFQLGAELRYIDAGNVLHAVLDQPGTATFVMDGGTQSMKEMYYDRHTQSLIAACLGGQVGVCPDATKMCVAKIPLNAAGTQVIGAVSGAQAEVSTSGETPVDMSGLPGNRVLVVIQTNNGAQEPRMLALDPTAMTIATYAANGPYTGASTTSAGVYSSVRNEVVILDSFNDYLRSFPEGGTGSGSAFSTPLTGYGVSGNGFDEACGLVEIAPVPTSVRSAALPSNLILDPVYPNPFNPASTLRYHLEHDASVQLAVYDVGGRRVRTLFAGNRPSGWHEATWDGADANGSRVASGVYFLRLMSGNEARVRRFVVVR